MVPKYDIVGGSFKSRRLKAILLKDCKYEDICKLYDRYVIGSWRKITAIDYADAAKLANVEVLEEFKKGMVITLWI